MVWKLVAIGAIQSTWSWPGLDACGDGVETTRKECAVVVHIQTTFVAPATVKSGRACVQAMRYAVGKPTMVRR